MRFAKTKSKLKFFRELSKSIIIIRKIKKIYRRRRRCRNKFELLLIQIQ